MTSSARPSAADDDASLIEALLSEEESRTLDFKRAGDNDRKVKTVVAFANTDGGLLAIGVEEAKKAKGRDRLFGIQENPESVDELRRLIRQRITPALDVDGGIGPQFIELPCVLRDGTQGSVMVVQIAKSRHVHSIIDGGTYVRLDHSVRQLSAAEISELAMQRGTKSWVDGLVDVDLDLLETAWWRQYATHRRLTRPIGDAMRHIGLARLDETNAIRPSRAAVLLFAEEPSGLLDAKCSIRLFHYKGEKIEHSAQTNLMRPPRTISGPIVEQIRRAKEAVLDALATGVQVGPLGFEIVQRYPVRVLTEAITNAVIHRDYRLQADVHIRIFSNRVEVESPGLLPGNLTAATIRSAGSRPRNRAIVDHLREFPNPPNLDAGEGVPMMYETMERAALYPPLYMTPPEWVREAVVCVCFNEERPSAWNQVKAHLDTHREIGNAEVRKVLRTDDPVRASKQLRSWVRLGLLVIVDPRAAKQRRRYRLPGTAEGGLFSRVLGKQPGEPS